MPFRPFSSVPEEILLNILGFGNATDHLNIKLVSTRFYHCAVAINTKSLSLAEAAKCHAAIEATFPRNRALRHCCCSRCGLVKDTDQFSDPQAKKKKKGRTCIACGIGRKKYSDKCLPSVGGEERIPCYDCLRPMPTYDGWRLKSAEAKLLLRPGSSTTGEILCEHCLDFKLWFVTCTPSLQDFLLMDGCSCHYDTMQERNQEIARIHADPVCAWYWQKVGL